MQPDKTIVGFQVSSMTESALANRDVRPLQLCLFVSDADLKYQLNLTSTPSPYSNPAAPYVRTADPGASAVQGQLVCQAVQGPPASQAVQDPTAEHASWFRGLCVGEGKAGRTVQGLAANPKGLQQLLEALTETLPWASLEALTNYRETLQGDLPSSLWLSMPFGALRTSLPRGGVVCMC
jgi:hypothetical protein